MEDGGETAEFATASHPLPSEPPTRMSAIVYAGSMPRTHSAEGVVGLNHQRGIAQQIQLNTPVAIEIPAHSRDDGHAPAVLVVERNLLVVRVFVAVDGFVA